MSEVKLWALVADAVPVGGQPVTVAYGPVLGGMIQNPAASEDQGVSLLEVLYIDFTGSAALYETATTFPIQPGQIFYFPEGVRQVSVNAASAGHKFSGIVVHEPPNYQPSTNPFPPTAPTTRTAVIPSYLYLQYNDDEDLIAFVEAYNELAQLYVTWFATIMLPVYTNPNVSGSLLDWVASGLYGMIRPALPSGMSRDLGALNTYQLNTLAINELDIRGPSNYFLTDDDVFRRILTWHLWKGDGKLFDIRWLKRRIKRFLTGLNGGTGYVDETYDISVTFGVDNQVNINLQSTRRYADGGAIIGAGLINDFTINEFITTSISIPVSPLAPIFKAAVDAGVLELPFQFQFIVNTN